MSCSPAGIPPRKQTFCLQTVHDSVFVASLRKIRKASLQNEVALPHDFVPAPTSILCHRGGKEVYDHEGNFRFRNVLNKYKDRYHQVETRAEKSLVVIDIVDEIRTYHEKATGTMEGAFVKKMGHGGWVDVGDAMARRKVGQAIRLSAKSTVHIRGLKENGEETKKSDSEPIPVSPVEETEKSYSEPLPVSAVFAKKSQRERAAFPTTSHQTVLPADNTSHAFLHESLDALPIRFQDIDDLHWKDDTIDLLNELLGDV